MPKPTRFPELRARQAARLLLFGLSVHRTARRLRMSDSRLQALVKTPRFQELLDETEAQYREGTRRQVSRLIGETVEKLRVLLRHPDPEVVLQAAEMVASHFPTFSPRPEGPSSGQVLDITPRALPAPLWPKLPPALTNGHGRED